VEYPADDWRPRSQDYLKEVCDEAMEIVEDLK
jgi:hypothetical protein